LILLPLAALAGLAMPTGAQAQEVYHPDPSCAPNYYDGSACQGQDQAASASECHIATWVQGASCLLTVADGQTTSMGVGFTNNAESDEQVSYHVVLRDPQSGTVLFETSDQGGAPAVGGLWNTNGGNGIGTALPTITTDEVFCEITGTHTKYGAAVGVADNSFSCSVN
jgi:hypothetical protein